MAAGDPRPLQFDGSEARPKARRGSFPVGSGGRKRRCVVRYRATRFIDAIHQRFAEEFSGLIHCARCAAPNCGRWFLKSAGRGDRRFCSHPCKMRTFRRDQKAQVTS